MKALAAHIFLWMVPRLQITNNKATPPEEPRAHESVYSHARFADSALFGSN